MMQEKLNLGFSFSRTISFTPTVFFNKLFKVISCVVSEDSALIFFRDTFAPFGQFPADCSKVVIFFLG